MKRRKAMALLTVLVMTSATLLGGCGSKEDTQTTKKDEKKTESEEKSEGMKEEMYDGEIILGQSSWVGYAPLYLADKKGFFDECGADVTIQSFESKTDSKSALAARKIQGMSSTVDTHVMSAASGMDLKLVLALDTSSGGDGLIAKHEFKDVKSLAGKTVGLDTSGGASYFWFQYLLQKEGMTLEDVKAVNMSSGDAGAAFVAGEVDAAVTWEPWLSRAKETDFGGVLMDSSETPGVIVDALVMDAEFTNDYPGSVKAIVQGYYKALAYMESDPEDAYTIMCEYTGDESAEALQATMDSEVTFYDQAGNVAYFNGEVQAIAKQASDLWIEMKLIESEPDLDSFIDNSYLE